MLTGRSGIGGHDALVFGTGQVMTRHPGLHTARMMAEMACGNNLVSGRGTDIFDHPVRIHPGEQHLLTALFRDTKHERGDRRSEQEGVFIDFSDYQVITVLRIRIHR
ncbi:hypothetical protein AHY55_25510, partial [Salmonella enterica subsp. enterica]|nr:hypothetical protein [Salmonella enterica subsp. enterica serovar Wandsworth]